MGIAVLVATLVAGAHQSGAAGSAYKCYVSDSLYDGLVPGKVQAAGSVDCSGYGGAGSVTFKVRLQRYDAQAKRWKNVASRSRRFKTLRKRHSFSVTSACVETKFRATYTAYLNSAGGAPVSRNRQKLGPLQVHVPCVVTIGGPGHPLSDPLLP